nr:GNAT family N-acetyltransferase [Neobacillus sp. Marseille-Q6967]
MEIKELTEKDLIESLKLSMYAFQYKIPEEKIASRLESAKSHKIYGIWQEEQLAAKLHIIPLHIYMNGREWKMGGLAGVATYPEYRRNGYVKKLIIDALEKMHQEKQIVSLLHPFDIGFYRKFGWEIFTDNKKIFIDKKDLKFLDPQPGNIKRYSKEQHHQEIESIYANFSMKFNGMLVRDSNWWKNNIYGDGYIAVYYNVQHQPMGYLLYEVQKHQMEVHEFVPLNHEARCGLWNFICQHDSMVDQVSILTSKDETLTYILNQPKVKTELTPYFMSRIIDAEQCLKRYQFNHTTEKIFLHIDDQFAPWNNGSYLISQDDIRVFKNKPGSSCVHPPQKGLSMDINSLASLLFGYKRPTELFEMGYIRGNEKEAAELEGMIPQNKPFFNDFF